MARDFSGSDYIEVADNNLLDLTSQITILMWVKFDSLAADFHSMLSKEQNAGDGYGFMINISATPDAIALALPSSNWEDYSADYTLSTGQWYHLAGTFDGTNAHIYVNGTEISGVSSGTLGLNANNENIRIGAASATIGDREIDGQMAEIAIWNIKLIDEEIVSLAKGFSPLFIRPQNLIAYWPLIRRLNDKINGLNGTATGTTVVSHPRMIYPTKPQM